MTQDTDSRRELWTETMGRSGNPLGRRRRLRHGGGLVCEVHDQTVLTDSARIDVFEWAYENADIPRDGPGDDDAATGWDRVASDTFDDAADALVMFNDHTNRELVDALRRHTTGADRILPDEA